MRGKKIRLFLCLLILGAYGLHGNLARPEAPSCSYCGMYKSRFKHSWVNIVHADGSVTSVCSVHCAAIDMALHTEKIIRDITVADYDTHKQINADRAFWVIGGEIMGVMTARAKWAFATREGADNFIKKHGGRSATFGEVIKAAFEDMYQDTLMIRQKRKLLNLRKNQ